jgi:hypothetical protein
MTAAHLMLIFDQSCFVAVRELCRSPGSGPLQSAIRLGWFAQSRTFVEVAALQNLTATQSTVTWTRGGASPQFARVTFESSTDNVNYALLGNGTASGSNWTLTGVNLPAGQNIYLRARGYYRGGTVLCKPPGSGPLQSSIRRISQVRGSS